MKKIEMLKLWMLGLGIPLSLLENKRVKFELEQSPIDGVGLLRAFQSNIYRMPEATAEAGKNLQDPLYQLELIMLFQE